jgi:DNA (cytosine-5)-methyltransferase 1
MKNNIKASKYIKKKPTAIDLFAGCGGLSSGLVKAGFEVIGAVEIDACAYETYAANHNKVHLIREDIREVSPKQMMKTIGLKRGELHLLAGCPPCQSFSRLRKRNRTRAALDARNDLIFDMVRFVRDMRPKAVMLENVPGLATHYRFNLFQQNLASLGYNGKWATLDAADYGVAQRRKRLIYVALRQAEPNMAKPQKSHKTVKGVIGGLAKPGASGDSLHDMPSVHSEEVMKRIRSIPKDGGSRADLPIYLQLQCHKNSNGFKDVYGRMKWDDVAPTITGGCFNPSKGRFLHPSEDRAITLREAALLQGFPRKYKFKVEHGKTAIALMIGNALPPPFIAAHARAIRKSLAI